MLECHFQSTVKMQWGIMNVAEKFYQCISISAEKSQYYDTKICLPTLHFTWQRIKIFDRIVIQAIAQRTNYSHTYIMMPSIIIYVCIRYILVVY